MKKRFKKRTTKHVPKAESSTSAKALYAANHATVTCSRSHYDTLMKIKDVTGFPVSELVDAAVSKLLCRSC